LEEQRLQEGEQWVREDSRKQESEADQPVLSGLGKPGRTLDY
jgi:hypothetical protein